MLQDVITPIAMFAYIHALTTFRTAIPDPQVRKETVAWIRSEFERNKHLNDLVRLLSTLYAIVLICFKSVIEERLAVGRRELKQILPMLGMRLTKVQ